MPVDKCISYTRLVHARKLCKACHNVTDPSKPHSNGICLDSGEISPWSRWQNSLDAKILLVGQEGDDTRSQVKHDGEEWDSGETNKNLIRLFRSIGIYIEGPANDEKHKDLFFTNAVLCLNKARSEADDSWFRNCGKLFLRPLIELIEPNAVITLGEKAYKAIMDAYYRALPRYHTFSEVVDRSGEIQLSIKTRLFAVCHPARKIINTYRPMDVQYKDWEKIKKYMDSIKLVTAPRIPIIR